ncbi:MAG: hypothetical protein IAI49_14620 [Candidatus Eremiobacteraeota bacterium]|nr:hypothetical protein [Candidatus Eremiobacteraeota bacterium]
MTEDPRIGALPDSHGHAKGEHKAFAEERPIPYTARMLFLWFFHACRRGAPRFMMVADHINYLTFEDPAAVHVVRRALKLAQAGDLYGAAETAGVELGHASVVSEGLRKGMRYSIGAEVDNDPRSRPDAQNIVDAMKPDGLVRSVHFLPIVHPQHGENWMWAFDNPEFKDFFDVVGTERVWELYMETLLDAIEKLPGHIVGHFYVPAKFGHWPDDAALEGYEDKLIDACAERGMAIEINSRYLYKYYVADEAQLDKFRAVHLRLMRKAKAKGVMIAVGSDAHSPRDQGSAFETILEMLDEAEINEIAFPLNDRLARVALRATEEILRQHSAALAGPPPAARATATLDADDDDDGDEAPATVEPRLETRNANAEIILPPGSEPALAAEALAEADAAAVPAAETKTEPKPRKSRAKPKVVAAQPEPEPVDVPDPKDAALDSLFGGAPDTVVMVRESEALSPAETEPRPRPKPALHPKPLVPKQHEPAHAEKHVEPGGQKRATPKPSASAAVATKPPAPSKAAASKPAASKPAGRKPAPAKDGPVKSAATALSRAASAVVKALSGKPATPAKPAVQAKPAAKKAAASRPAAKKRVAAAKAAPKKAVPAKKTVAKAAPKKSAAKKSAAKPVAKKSSAKGTSKKAAPARKSVAAAKRPAVAKRSATKKPAPKKSAKKKSTRR